MEGFDGDDRKRDEKAYVVHGALKDEEGRELSGAKVTIFWQRIRDRHVLVRGVASEEGTYHLRYRPPDDAPGIILIVVEAHSPKLKKALGSQPTPAQPDLQIDLTAEPEDKSEYAALVRSIKPLLGKLKLSDLREDNRHHDISFLSQATGRSTEEIMRLVVSDRLEVAYEIQAQAFYSFIRQSVPPTIPAPLLQASQSFELIDALVKRIATLTFALSREVQENTLNSAIKNNYVSPSLAEQIPKILAEMQAHRTTNVLERPYLTGKTTLTQLLDASQLPKASQNKFAEALVANTKRMEVFWQQLADGQHGFTPQEVASVRQTLELGAFVKNHLPVVQALKAKFASGDFTSLTDLAKMTKDQWLQLITDSGPGAVPSNISPAGGSSPEQVFAQEIYERVTRAYPTAALAARITTGTFIPAPQQAPLAKFFDTNSQLDLRRENFDAYLKQQGEKAWAGVSQEDRPAVIANVKSFQRVLRIAPHVDTTQSLLEQGLDSAAQITMLGKQQFVNTMEKAGLTRLEGYKVFYSAEQRYASTVSLFTQFNGAAMGLWPAAFGNNTAYWGAVQDAVQANPSLATLFGSQDFCTVDTCNSVLSPAAYLTDLLLWLRNRAKKAGSTPLDVLLRRRPDIGNLLLNCPNTQTPLPYVDLVNELLEDAVAPPMAPTWYQTTLSAEELRAAPEYVNWDAYTTLAGANYPHTLPYDDALDELRTYLGQSGITLWQLRHNLTPVHGATPLAQSSSIAAERFGIGPHELDLVTNANFVSLAVAWNTGNPVTDLATASDFLQAAGITYEQLLELIEVVWTRSGGSAIILQGLNDRCDTTQITLATLDATKLDRIHRFLRLWRRTGWNMWELDLLLMAPLVGNGTLGQNGLVALFTFRQLQDATRLSADQLLAFFQDIDTSVHRNPDGTSNTSLYDQLFQNPSVPADPALVLATLLAGPPPPLANHMDAVRAALQVSSASDGATLVGLTNNQLTLDNLSLLYRVLLLGGVVRLSLTDLVTALTLSGHLTAGAPPTIDVFANPSTSLSFIQEMGVVRQSGFTIDELTYVLTTGPTPVGITQDRTTADITDVRSAMQRVHDDVYGSTDPPLTILTREFAKLPAFSDQTILATAISIVNGTFTGTVAQQNAFISAYFGTFMDVPTAQAALAGFVPHPPGGPAGLQAEINTRANAILGPLANYLTTAQVVATVAGDLHLASDIARLLMGRLTVPGTTLTPLAILTDPTIIAKLPNSSDYAQAINPTNFPHQYLAVELLDKEAVVVHRLHLVASDLDWLLTNSSVYGGLDLAHLPVTGAQPPLSLASLLQTVLLVKLDRLFTAAANSTANPPPSVQSLYDLVSAVHSGSVAADAAAQGSLSTITGWPQADVQALTAAVGITLGGGDYVNPAAYDRLRLLMAMESAAGGSGAELVSWGVASPDETTAASAQQALKSRYSNDAWLQVAPTMMDPIRDHREQALIAYLLGQKTYGTDANDLFDHFLIDVQMTSCMLTTRVIQAYAAVQLFTQRSLMNLEPDVTADPSSDDGWLQWNWMQRYRIWQANREVFLWPENWLVESQRPNRTEIYRKLEQEVHQQEMTTQNFETITLNYVDRLDEISHLVVTGSYYDGASQVLHVVARTAADPPRFYHRTLEEGAWTGWQQIHLDIKSHQVIPVVYRRSVYLFWPSIITANEPQQQLPPAQLSTSSDPIESPPAARHVEISLGFSAFRNGAWTPVQHMKGKFFDFPILDSQAMTDNRAIETLYSLKSETSGSYLFIDVFRLGTFDINNDNPPWVTGWNLHQGVHLARATFDGRFNDLELRDLAVITNSYMIGPNEVVMSFHRTRDTLLARAQRMYGPDAQGLEPLPESQALADITGEPGLDPESGALLTKARGPSDPATIPLNFTAVGLEQAVGALLDTAPVPFRVVGPNTDMNFDPTSSFLYADTLRSYYVVSTRYYQYGSQWRPVVPSNPADTPFEMRYAFKRFYHPYTRLLWHELSSGGFPALYSRDVQLAPDTVDPTHHDAFSFESTYQPIVGRVSWGEDNEILDFSPDAAYSVYNWELFFHAPLMLAELLSQNQKFEDSLKWFQYIFDPTRPGPDPVPQRYWITKPLNALTSADILAQNINNLLLLVNQQDPNEVHQVDRWRKDPFNPFLIADGRLVAYMKRVVMSYLDNLIAWGDNLFATNSREALNEATLLYVIASEILGPQPQGLTPPPHLDDSFDQLLPKLDAFANAMIDIENFVPSGGSGGGGGGGGGPMPAPQTFYFKIPPNDKLLGYWSTVADRLFKLRHCQNIEGVAEQLALFDSPIDPGLLVRAQAAGVDIGSVLNEESAPLPNYRYSSLYPAALDFLEAVRSYGAQLLDALEKDDAGALALLQATSQQQLLQDAMGMYQAKVDQAQAEIDATNQAFLLAQEQVDFYTQQTNQLLNPAQIVATVLQGTTVYLNTLVAIAKAVAGGLYIIPQFAIGAAGAGGSPQANASTGGQSAGDAADKTAEATKAVAEATDKAADMAKDLGERLDKQDDNRQKMKEAQFAVQQAQAKIVSAQLAMQIAEGDKANHQESIDDLQKQIDFLHNKFTSQDLYDWMVSELSTTYFQSYKLAYSLAKRVERCYRYELSLQDSSFVTFGYWDSLKKGLLAGEYLVHDLRRMNSSYLDLNVRRFEVSRFVSLGGLNPQALIKLLQTGACDFDVPELLFDLDYPGQYQRRLKWVSITVVYPGARPQDNVKCKLTLVKNSVRLTTDLNPSYDRVPLPGTDLRFVDQFAAVQSVVTGNAQEDTGLFETSIHDERYLPFEGAGAISSWHLEMRQENNEIDLASVGDVVLHLHYTALDGGDQLQQAVESSDLYTAATQPTQGLALFSAQRDFPTEWQSFFSPMPAGSDQVLTLPLAASRFPSRTRGRTITVTSLTAYAVSEVGGDFILKPQSPLPTVNVTLHPDVAGPNVAYGTVTPSPGMGPGTWSFKLKTSTAADWKSLASDQIGDFLLLVNFQMS